MIVFADIEWTWGEALLNESARDVVNVVGFGLTFVGLAVAWFQLRKTQSAAKAAEVAANKTLEESRFAFYKFTVALALRYVHEAKIHIDNEAWERATIRLSDLTDQVNQLISMDDTWTAFADELHRWSMTCNQLKNNERKRLPEKQKWLEFCSHLETKLSQMLAPFANI